MVLKNKLNNLYLNPNNTEEIPMPKDSIEGLLSEVRGYAPTEKVALEVAFDMMYKSEKREILLRVFSNERQKDIADDLNVTPQYISKVWREFINSVKEEL